jgi:hypothetical protein
LMMIIKKEGGVKLEKLPKKDIAPKIELIS